MERGALFLDGDDGGIGGDFRGDGIGGFGVVVGFREEIFRGGGGIFGAEMIDDKGGNARSSRPANLESPAGYPS